MARLAVSSSASPRTPVYSAMHTHIRGFAPRCMYCLADCTRASEHFTSSTGANIYFFNYVLASFSPILNLSMRSIFIFLSVLYQLTCEFYHKIFIDDTIAQFLMKRQFLLFHMHKFRHSSLQLITLIRLHIFWTRADIRASLGWSN